MTNAPQNKMIMPGRIKNHVLKRRVRVGVNVFYPGSVIPVGKYPELDAILAEDSRGT